MTRSSLSAWTLVNRRRHFHENRTEMNELYDSSPATLRSAEVASAVPLHLTASLWVLTDYYVFIVIQNGLAGPAIDARSASAELRERFGQFFDSVPRNIRSASRLAEEMAPRSRAGDVAAGRAAHQVPDPGGPLDREMVPELRLAADGHEGVRRASR